MQAKERGLAVVALEALCHHNSATVALPGAFFASAQVFAHKWKHRLPVATPCAIIDRQGRVNPLGNTTYEAGGVNHESHESHESDCGNRK